MKAVVFVPQISTSEGSTFHLLICWSIIIIIITQYLSHCHFHCHRCSYDNYFYKLVLFHHHCFRYLLYFFFFIDLKDPMWLVWLPFLLIPNHCPFFVTWEISGVEMEDGRQSWRLTAERCILLLIIYLVYKPALFQNVAS